jgi:outer membrane translocation and assembly module TamA
LGVFLSSCGSTRFLNKEKGESYLVGNEVKITSSPEMKSRGKSRLNYDLEKLYLQKPNRRFFFVPRQYFFYTSLDTLKKSKLGKTFSKVQGEVLGEEPAILDTNLVAKTSNSMTSYLKNKGYFYAHVEDVINFNRKFTKAKVTYQVSPGRIYTVDTLLFTSIDTAIQRLLQTISGETQLSKGKPVDLELYNKEVARITFFLRNNGYAYFYPQSIGTLVGIDSSNENRTVKLQLEVFPPVGRPNHKTYKIGNIYLNPYFDPADPALPPGDTIVDGIQFANQNLSFKIKPRTLTGSVYFRSGETFSQEAVDNTIRQLGALGVFRPPTVRFEENPLNPEILDFFILLTPTKKWEFGADFDINTVERKGAVGNRNLIGLSFSPSLRNRNFLKGAELLIGTVDMGVEFAPFGPDTSFINTLDLRIQGDLYFPRFTDYFKFWRNSQKLGLINDRFYDQMRRRGTSRFSSSYNLLVLLDNYSLQFVNLSFGNDIPLRQSGGRLIFNHFGIDLVLPKIAKGSYFEELLQRQPFLENSFSKQLITGIAFRDVILQLTSKQNPSGSYWFFRGYFDLSGLEIMATNSLINAVSGKSPDIKFFNIDFSHYAKFEIDSRRYWQFGLNRTLVARINTGIAFPYYQSTTVPYVKQFFVGGPYSLRGWYARALGPGLYRDPLSDDPTQRNLFYQSGNAKFEINLEYRFLFMRPFGLFNLYGALFLDAGNIWTLENDPNRPGSQLAWKRIFSKDGKIIQDNLLREIALSSGLGSRLDFTYFIFRLDLGLPLRNNYPNSIKNQSYWSDFKNIGLRDVVFNIGLGYPF